MLNHTVENSDVKTDVEEDYEAPRIESLITRETFQREVHYAGTLFTVIRG